MGESQQVRLQQDIVDEIEQYEGGSFSEKFRNWRNTEIVERMENIGASDSLSREDVKKAVEEALPSGVYR